jgi:hypothetical protein
MTSTILSALAPALISASVALIVVVLSGQIAAARAHDDRVWTRKAAAYSTIIAALGDLEDAFDWWFDVNYDLRRPSQSQEAAQRKIYQEAKRQLLRAMNGEAWLLPVEVVTLVRELRTALNKRYKTWSEELDECSAATVRTMTGLEAIARNDMGR